MDKRVSDELHRESKYDTVTADSSVFEIDLKARALIVAANANGWKVAAENLRYYLDGDAKKKIDVKMSRNWLRGFRRYREIEQQLRVTAQNDVLSDIRDRINSGSKGSSVFRVEHDTEYLVSYNNNAVSKEELFYASGDSRLAAKIRMEVKMTGDNVNVSGKIYYHWHDGYNFHNKKSVLIPLLGRIPDKAMLKLEREGTAHPYTMFCDYSQSLEATTFKSNQWRNSGNIKWNWGTAF